MKTLFRGVPLEAARSAAVTAVRTLRKIPTDLKG
jgi:hypothetical protein